MAIDLTSNSKNLYESDYMKWIEHTVHHLKQREFVQIDWNKLIDELEDMGRSERRSLKSNLVIVLLHLLKWNYQTEFRSRSWQISLLEHRRRIRDILSDSPSLKSYLETVLPECYDDAVAQAVVETRLATETFPAACPYPLVPILDALFLPDDDG